MTPTRLIFVRHGDAVITEPGRPRTLTPTGAKQAKTAGNALANRTIAGIWSSSMARAEQTAAILGGLLNLPVQLDDRLRERQDEDPAPGIAAPDDDPDFVLQRLNSMVTDIIGACPGQTALVVTHGGITTHGLLRMCENLDEEYVAAHQLGNCAISEVVIDDSGEWTCISWDGCASDTW